MDETNGIKMKTVNGYPELVLEVDVRDERLDLWLEAGAPEVPAER
jgi:hypothetical protein